MAYKLLVVEDDKDIREIIKDYFTDENKSQVFNVTEAENGTKALEIISENEFNLVFLDVMLPGLDGFSICRKIREKQDVPVIFISARTMEEDVLLGFETGCDDYVTKPFNLATLYAKSIALISRSQGMVVDKYLCFGNIKVDKEKNLVMCDGKWQQFSPKEFDLLVYFMEHKDMVLSRERLLNAVWGSDLDVYDRVVDDHIRKLRKLLGKNGKLIKTVPTKGYKITDK